MWQPWLLWPHTGQEGTDPSGDEGVLRPAPCDASGWGAAEDRQVNLPRAPFTQMTLIWIELCSFTHLIQIQPTSGGGLLN